MIIFSGGKPSCVSREGASVDNIGVHDNEVLHLLCGRLLGEGAQRRVYACTLGPKYVVKVVESCARHRFANIMEWELWEYISNYACETARWFAPCVSISHSGRFMIQERTRPATQADLDTVKEVPRFMHDLKPNNWGMLGRGAKARLVCHDYAITHVFRDAGLRNPKLKTVEWPDINASSSKANSAALTNSHRHCDHGSDLT